MFYVTWTWYVFPSYGGYILCPGLRQMKYEGLWSSCDCCSKGVVVWMCCRIRQTRWVECPPKKKYTPPQQIFTLKLYWKFLPNYTWDLFAKFKESSKMFYQDTWEYFFHPQPKTSKIVKKWDPFLEGRGGQSIKKNIFTYCVCFLQFWKKN